MSHYQHIEKACLLIALDNGGINRTRSEGNWRGEYARWIAKQDGRLAEIDAWLGSLPPQIFEAVCIGGHDEIETIAAKADAAPFFDALLNAYFDEVC